MELRKKTGRKKEWNETTEWLNPRNWHREKEPAWEKKETECELNREKYARTKLAKWKM